MTAQEQLTTKVESGEIELIRQGDSTHPMGTQDIFRCPNGKGASIVWHRFSYGGGERLLEGAVLQFADNGEWSLDYSTPITNDVVGWMTAEQAAQFVLDIAAL